MLDQFSKRAFLTAVVGQQVVPASTLDDLTTRKMMLHAVQSPALCWPTLSSMSVMFMP